MFFRKPKPAEMLTPKQVLGERGEAAAVRHLRHAGYKILARRFRCKHGEIDIVCRDNDWLVFVEVKARKSEQFGLPSEAVDAKKQRHISKVALEYLRLLDFPQVKCRFDIVEVILKPGANDPESVRLYQNAFEVSEPYIY